MYVLRVFFNVVEVCGYIFISFIFDLHAAKNITMPYCAAFGGKHHSAKFRELSLKPEVVPTIFRHVPQPKASTTHIRTIKRTVKLECEAVSKQ